MKKVRIFLFNGILLTATSLILKSIGMFFGIYLSNKIGTESVGIYQLIMSIYMFFVTFASSGINLATSRIISEQIAYNKEHLIKNAMKKCIFYSLFMGILACIVLFAFSPIISTYYLHDKVSQLPLKIIAISLPFLSVSNCINGYFSAISNVKKTAISQVFEQLLKIILVIFFINLFTPLKIEYACIALVLGSTIAEILSCILLFIFYKLNINNKRSIEPKNDNYTKQILRITFPIAITSYIRSGLSTLKQLLIPIKLEQSGLSCEIALSKYGIVNGMAMPLILFPCNFISSFSSLLIPEFSYLNAKKDYKKINFAISKILRFCFIFSFLIMGIFLLFSNEISNSIYKDSDVSIFIKILSPLIVLMYIDSIVDSILKGMDKQVSVMVINILDLLTSISFIYFLLPICGIKGYIIVLFISEFFNGIVSLFVLIKETRLNIDFNNWIFKPCFTLIVIYFIFKNFTCNSILELVFQVIIFCICYFIIIYLLKGFIKDDFKF